ncbi:hypothetical protein Q3G72_000629 [Acer saccharum]|nr:hypothetical protein Q3G72_000629 [Acer saccharum]
MYFVILAKQLFPAKSYWTCSPSLINLVNKSFTPLLGISAVIGNELILSQQPESQDYWYEVSDDEEQPASGVNIRPTGVEIGPTDAGVEVGSDGVNIGTAGVEIGPADASVEVGSGGVEIGPAGVGVEIGLGESTEDEEAVESDYEQELDDIKADTCVDPTRDWESLQVLGIPHAQCGSRSGFDIDLGSDDLKSLDGSDGEEDEGGPPRKFIKTKYREFNPSYDMQDPIFRVGMEFGNANIFRKAIRAHSVKHRNVV